MRGIAVIPAVLAWSMLCAPAAPGQGTDTLVVLHTSDTHVLYSPEKYPPALNRYFTGNRDAVDSVEHFFRTVPGKEKADAVVITGDLLACFEGESASGDMLAGQIDRFRGLYGECPVPLLMTLGNHDLSSYTLRKGDSAVVTSQNSAGRARASWIRNISCFAEGTYYARTFQVGGTRYHFLFLDDGYSLHDGGRRLDKTQLDWFAEQVGSAGDDPVVVFHHIYFPSGAQDSREGFLNVLNSHRNIRLLVVGHGHANVAEKIRFPAGHSVYQVETGSVTEGAKNWRLLRCAEKEITVSQPGSRETALSIEVHEKEDYNDPGR